MSDDSDGDEPAFLCPTPEVFWDRWEQTDRPLMLELLQNHGSASYPWEVVLNEEEEEEPRDDDSSARPNLIDPRDIREAPAWSELLGEYDIVFMQVGEWSSPGLSVAPGGTLSLCRTEEDGEIEVTIQNMPAPFSKETFGDPVRGWDAIEMITMQSQWKVRFQEKRERNHPLCCWVQGVLHNEGSYAWSPVFFPFILEPGFGPYVEFMRNLVKKRVNGSPAEEHCWLCNHFGLPVEAAETIYSFNQHALPPALQWSWKPGDIQFYVHGEVSFYARPREQETRERVLEASAANPRRSNIAN